MEELHGYKIFSYQYDIRIRLCSLRGGSHGSYGSPLNTSLLRIKVLKLSKFLKLSDITK